MAVGQINGGLSDCGPIQIHLIDTRILDLEWTATIYIIDGHIDLKVHDNNAHVCLTVLRKVNRNILMTR